MKPVNLPRLHCALLGLLPLRASGCRAPVWRAEADWRVKCRPEGKPVFLGHKLIK